MNETLTITSYVDATYDEVIDELNNGGAGLIESAARISEARVSRPGPFLGTIEATRVGDNDLEVRVSADAAHLDGATVTVAPVGEETAGVTELVVRMGQRFESGDRGSRQFLAASTLLQQATEALGKDRPAA